jgi:3-hydroxybutyryl-CoA dehydratase
VVGKTVHDLKIGQSAEFSKTLSESDIYQFAGLTGDFNPAHVNQAYAEKSYFKQRIAHGLLSASFISTVIGMQLPGTGAIYVEQEVKFLAPVYIGDTVTARVEVSEIDMNKNRVRLITRCFNQHDQMVVDGTAVVSPPKRKTVQG